MKFKTRGAAKNLSLDTSTGTWPPKARNLDRGDAREVLGQGRPRTATLEKPLVLDISLLGHLDMTTLTRRGLLNVCRFPIGKKKNTQTGVIGLLGVAPPPAPAATSPGGGRHGSRASSKSDLSADEDSGSRRSTTKKGSTRALTRQKKPVIEEDDEGSWAEDLSAGTADRSGTFRVRRNNRLNRTYRIPAVSKTKRQSILMNNNNDGDLSEDGAVRGQPGGQPEGRRRVVGGHRQVLEEILSAPVFKEQVPEPCRTCGRTELPERFHSHPKKPTAKVPVNHHGYGPLPVRQNGNHLSPAKVPVNNHGFAHLPEKHHVGQPNVGVDEVLVKSSVKKPVPIRYKARTSLDTSENSPPVPVITRTRSPAKSPQQQPQVTQFVDADVGGAGSGPGGSPIRGPKGPRTVMCYVCGREFGTASLPLHEPHCVQRWHLQNSKLPPHWQRQLPQKPASLITIDEWNKFAWESAKGADSVQCPNCLRRFLPDRINSHERVCFVKHPAVAAGPDSSGPRSGGAGAGSPLVECYICGKKFGTRSIGIHEPQCLKKWQQQNADPDGALPSHPRLAIDKPRERPQIEGPADSKPLAIEFPAHAPAPRPGPPATPGPRVPASGGRPKSARTPSSERRASQRGPASLSAGAHPEPQMGPPQPEPHAGSQGTRQRSAWAGEVGVLGQAPQPGSESGAGAAAAAPSEQTAKPKKQKSHPQQTTHPLQTTHPQQTTQPPGNAVAMATSGPGQSAKGRPLRCYLCGRMYSLQSLSIHEPQCLVKWRAENAKLPQTQQRPEPVKPDIIFTEDGDVDYWQTFDRIWANHTESLVPCRTCGRRFFPDRIETHERSCIKNTKKKAGSVDFNATEDAAWRTHLSQLIPCSQCGRRFCPDRIPVHERCCKGGDR